MNTFYTYDPITFLFLSVVTQEFQPENSTPVKIAVSQFFHSYKFNVATNSWEEGSDPITAKQFRDESIFTTREYFNGEIQNILGKWRQALQDYGDKIPASVESQIEPLRIGMFEQIFKYDPNFDADSLKSKIRMKLGFDITIDETIELDEDNYPTIPELVGIPSLRFIELGTEKMVPQPSYNNVTGKLNHAVNLGEKYSFEFYAY